jgi:hypothetical protein
MNARVDKLLLRALRRGPIITFSAGTASEAFGLQVFPAQHSRVRKIRVRPCQKPRGQKSAQFREVIRDKRSDVAGHDYGYGAVFRVIRQSSLFFALSLRVYHTRPNTESRNIQVELLESRAARTTQSQSCFKLHNRVA